MSGAGVGTSSRRQVPHAVLARSSLEPAWVCLLVKTLAGSFTCCGWSQLSVYITTGCGVMLPVGLAAAALLLLPHAAGVEGGDVLQPVAEAGDLVGLVPGQHPEVVRPHGLAAPLVVGGHHEVAVLVVAALLARAVIAAEKRKLEDALNSLTSGN